MNIGNSNMSRPKFGCRIHDDAVLFIVTGSAIGSGLVTERNGAI